MAFATRFATDYLTFNTLDPTKRSTRLRSYLTEKIELKKGLSITSTTQTGNTLPINVKMTNPNLNLITVAISQDQNHWLHLKMPIMAGSNDRLTVKNSPTLIAAPRKTSLPATDPQDLSRSDLADATRITPTLKTFFKTYAGDDPTALSYFLAKNAKMVGLGGTVSFERLSGMSLTTNAKTQKTRATMR
jgi:hypothetical protein